MTAPIVSDDSAPPPRRRRRRWLWLVALVPIVPVVAIWWFTEPLTDHPTAVPTKTVEKAPPVPIAPDIPTTWPEVSISGPEANRFLLASLQRTASRLDQIDGYTAILKKTERMGGKLGPEQTLTMKVRNRPFAIYLKFLAPKAGKEVVYAEGHHDNKVIAHNGDWTRRIVPRLAVPPDSALALADSRHPVTEAGLVHLTHKLMSFRKMDLDDPQARTVVDRINGSDGKPRLRSIHTHAINDGKRPFTRVEVLYDPETQFPIQISSYDWPTPDHGSELELAEQYVYEDLKLNAPLTQADFDPTNPDYAFMRF